MISTNDLILLRYGWGHRPGDGSGLTDCFQLVCELRKRFQLHDYTDLFAWVYEKYDNDTFPRSKIVRWLLEHGTRLNDPKPGCVALLPGGQGAALGTVMEDGTTVFIGPTHNVVRVELPKGTARHFWMER